MNLILLGYRSSSLYHNLLIDLKLLSSHTFTVTQVIFKKLSESGVRVCTAFFVFYLHHFKVADITSGRNPSTTSNISIIPQNSICCKMDISLEFFTTTEALYYFFWRYMIDDHMFLKKDGTSKCFTTFFTLEFY